MGKYNCWEYMKCGKGPNGNSTDKSCVCPVAANKAANGFNEGTNGGRLCWLIADTGCCGEVKHINRNGSNPCFACVFRFKVMEEEGLHNVCEATGHFLSISSNKRKPA